VLEHTNTELFRIKELTVADIDFTDIHYQTRKATANDKHIVLVNIGSSPQDSIRYTLIKVLKKLNSYKPKAIGIDIYFVPNKNIPDSMNRLLNTLFDAANVVIGAEKSSQSQFPLAGSATKINFGYLNFPDEHKKTIREYYYQHKVNHLNINTPILSFASKLDSIYTGRVEPVLHDSTFIMRYFGSDAGYYNALAPGDLADTVHDFQAVEVSNLLDSNFADSLKLHEMIKNKIVIIGWLGSPLMINDKDLTDKHRVPVNFELFNRLPTMPGAVVHANALQTLLKKDKLHKIEGWPHRLILGGIVFLYLLMFMMLHKLRPILLKLIIEIVILVASTLFLIWVSTLLMSNGWHLKIGTILLWIAVLIEYKMFAFEFYEYLEEKFGNWRHKTVIKEIKIPVKHEE
jgi:CHASE2 domain-containing sensor protein